MHRFIFIRHAEALCNVQTEGLIDSVSPDAPLTPVGEEQARRLALALSDELTGTQVFYSPLRRAVQTAHAIAACRGLLLVMDPRLEELRIAKTLTPPLDLVAWDQMLDARVAWPEREVLPGVETLLEQRARVKDFLCERHARRGEERLTLVVSHAFTIELAINVLLGLKVQALKQWRVRISNAALHVIENDELDGPSRLMLVNAKNHLGTFL
jgi:5''-phosphoribostamycin phosphatase/probable phosphoglycerate mutase